MVKYLETQIVRKKNKDIIFLLILNIKKKYHRNTGNICRNLIKKVKKLKAQLSTGARSWHFYTSMIHRFK